MSYYKELNRAKRHAINFINQEFYEPTIPRKISMNEIELEIDPDFQCNYTKVFLNVMELHKEGDKRIKYDQQKKIFYIDTELEK